MPIRAPCPRGFTLVELAAVMAVIAILASIALPSIIERLIRTQVVESLPLAEVAQQAVAAQYGASHVLPPDNAAAGLPPADKMVGNFVSSVTVRAGAIDLRFGNSAHKRLAGKTLTLRAAVVPDYPQVPIAWLCGMAAVPKNMSAPADNLTDIAPGLLPLRCRNLGAPG